MNSLKASELFCGYGDRQVLESLSIAACAGEVLVLLGPNGSGKTTLLRALARLLRPRHGTVLLRETDIWKQPATVVAQGLAMMPQNERRDWPLTVEESVKMGRAPHRGWLLPYRRVDREIVDDALRQTGLHELRHRAITELSGGEWRRMILARALAQQASVLLLDEPTNGLDLKYQVEVLRLIRKLTVREQLTVILSLHDLNLAAIFGHRVALLSKGKLSACGSPDEVLTAQQIGEVYGIPVTVTRHPVHHTPLVVPLPDASLDGS